MRRAIVNVSTGRYVTAGRKLLDSVQNQCDAAQFYLDVLPSCSPAHQEKPYAFKAYAFELARRSGAELVLWIDASVKLIRNLDPLWHKIERDGYWIAKNGWTNYEWTADSAYPDLFPGVPLDEAREINKTFPQVVATAFGLNLASEIGRKAFDEFYRLAQTNAFCGPWGNTNSPNGPKYCAEMMGACGPPDVLGHRHDQTSLSVIAWRLGMKLTECPEFFAYPPGDERTILLCVGA